MLKLLRRKSSFRRSKDFREDHREQDREAGGGGGGGSRRRSVDGFGNKSPRNYRRSSSGRHRSQERMRRSLVFVLMEVGGGM